MLRGLEGSDPVCERLYEMLSAGVEEGRLSVPLSTAHYLETWHRRDEQSRVALAGLMRDLSRYRTLAAVQRIERAGVAWLINRLLRPTTEVAVNPAMLVMGQGVNHAFDSPTGRFRVVESVADDKNAEGPPAEPARELLEAYKLGDVWEWVNLAGRQELYTMDGIEMAPEHRLGTKTMNDELAMREHVKSDPSLRRRLSDWIVATELVNINPYINDAAMRLNVDPHRLFDRGPEGGRRFVSSLAVTDVHCRLRIHRHRDFGFPIEQHDRTDLAALALAVPYCDVVVTERRWCHALEASGTSKKYRTRVLSSLRGLDKLIGSCS